MIRTALAAVVVVVTFAISAASGEARRVIAIGDDDVLGVMNARSVDDLVRRARSWRDAPAYQKVGLARKLLARIGEPRALETRGFRPEIGKHNLNVTSGRAAWALQELIGVAMPPAVEASVASDIVAAYRAGVIDAARELPDRRTTEALRAAFAHRITIGISDKAGESSGAMFELLSEWFPLGRRAEDLSRITGTVGTVDGEDRTYTFDTGYGGTQFRFTIDKGVVSAVAITSLE